MRRFLLIGSGQDALQARSWNLDGWRVGAIHNAWSVVPSRVFYFFRSGDFRPDKNNIPTQKFIQGVEVISYKEYDGQEQRSRFGRQEVGIGATMFFNAAYWILGNIEPYVLGFVGCSMNFPNGAANTFYGGGKADPLRFGKDTLCNWFALLGDTARKRSVKLINFGDGGLMPYPQERFPSNQAPSPSSAPTSTSLVIGTPPSAPR